MHPQLDKNRFDTCGQLMDALEKCHEAQFAQQILGMCNFEKDELVKCLHHQRVGDARQRARESQEKQRELLQRRKQHEEELYGKNGYLKKVIEEIKK